MLDKKIITNSKFLDSILVILGNPPDDLKSKNNNLNILDLVNDYKRNKKWINERKKSNKKF